MSSTKKDKPAHEVRYSDELAIKVCERIATTPISMALICRQPDMPSYTAFFRWLRDHEDFREMYVIAKQEQVELLIEQCIDIVDDDSNDIITTDDGRKIINTAAVRRAKMKVDFRKWLASKLLPRKYGNHRTAAAATPKPKPEPPPKPGVEVTEGGVEIDEEAEREKIMAAHQAWLADTLAGVEWEKQLEENRRKYYPDGRWIGPTTVRKPKQS